MFRGLLTKRTEIMGDVFVGVGDGDGEEVGESLGVLEENGKGWG